MATTTTDADMFSQEVARLRAEYQAKRQQSNAFPPAGRPILDMELAPGDKPAVGIWYEDGTKLGQYVRLFDIPGTLWGDILGLERPLPAVKGHYEIEGDVIRSLDKCPNHPTEPEDDFEDVSDLTAKLPLIDVDSSKHFTKKGKYRSEIENLLKCQGGSCPGALLSPHLLILHIIDALSCLHALGIVHRDLRIDNCLFTPDGSRLVVCDLESRWGQRAAPEVAFDGGVDDSGWTTRSDVYDIGNCIKCMVYANAPITNQVEWPVTEPLQAVVEACMRKSPDDRPSLLELREMVEAIPVDGR
ncbi:kinase-like domain-containing protein [Parachaetomium inaequale]|uniref:non-specific serine/threonine protein kinase n=1 Tax=Parachaetomium inaequale TaxID=2588326 RepID=A0AAN6PFV3_9PEZI|nr:kinase-like domain-containing protein [Parachaetomium inaequale]